MTALDETHDPSAVSWVESANGHGEFPIQNLPLCIFSRKGDLPRGGVAIGGFVLDMAALAASQLVTGVAAIAVGLVRADHAQCAARNGQRATASLAAMAV